MAIDSRAIQKSLNLTEKPHLYTSLCRKELYQLKNLIQNEPEASLLIGCEVEAPFFEEFLSEEEFQGHVSFTNLREECFWVHEKKEANLKATSLIRKDLEGIPFTSNGNRSQEDEIEVGKDVLVYGDGEACLSFARHVSAYLQPYVLIEEGFSQEKREGFLQGDDFVVDAGKILSVQGHLGEYRVSISHSNPIDLIHCTKCQKCLNECPKDAIDSFYQIKRGLCGPCHICAESCSDVGAIKLDRKEVRDRVFDQVVVLGSSFSIDSKVPPKGLYWFKEPQKVDLQTLALKISSLVGRHSKERLIRYHLQNCGWRGFKREGCTLCREVCPVEALEGTEQGIQWDSFRCIECGSCVSRCPNDSLTFQKLVAKEIYQGIYSLLSPMPGPPINKDTLNSSFLLFGCQKCGSEKLRAIGEKKIPYPASIRPFLLPSTALISEDHFLEAFRLGAAGVIILCCDCIPVIPDSLKEAIDQAREILQAFGVEEERIVLVEEKEPEKLAKQITSLDKELPPLPWKPQTNRKENCDKREVMKEALLHFMEATGHEPGLIPAGEHQSFATISIDEQNCTLCMSCVNVCHPKALRGGGDRPELSFVSWSCIACGLCDSLCPEHVITINRGLPLYSKAFGEEILMRDEVVSCTRCEKAFITKNALKKIQSVLAGSFHFDGDRKILLEMCEDCRSIHLFENNMEEVM
jgi:ferredoxin